MFVSEGAAILSTVSSCAIARCSLPSSNMESVGGMTYWLSDRFPFVSSNPLDLYGESLYWVLVYLVSNGSGREVFSGGSFSSRISFRPWLNLSCLISLPELNMTGDFASWSSWSRPIPTIFFEKSKSLWSTCGLKKSGFGGESKVLLAGSFSMSSSWIASSFCLALLLLSGDWFWLETTDIFSNPLGCVSIFYWSIGEEFNEVSMSAFWATDLACLTTFSLLCFLFVKLLLKPSVANYTVYLLLYPIVALCGTPGLGDVSPLRRFLSTFPNAATAYFLVANLRFSLFIFFLAIFYLLYILELYFESFFLFSFLLCSSASRSCYLSRFILSILYRR